MRIRFVISMVLIPFTFYMITLFTVLAQEPPSVNLSFEKIGHYQGRTNSGIDGIDEIVSIGLDGHIYVYSYQGHQLFKSLAGEWKLVATGDLDADGDHEIIAVGENKIRVYDLQFGGSSAFQFEAGYDNTGYMPSEVSTGNFLDGDDGEEIALLLTNSGKSKLLIFDPPNIQPVAVREWPTIEWRDFSVGDYDGDWDDDLVLIGWNYGAGITERGTLTLLEGEDINLSLEGSENAESTFDDEWLDIATGYINIYHLGAEWVGSRVSQQVTQVEYWTDGIYTDWAVAPAFEYVATTDFRNEGDDQVVMLRNTTDGISLQFAKKGVIWAKANDLGTGWLNLAGGNLDEDNLYLEAILVRGDLIRIYLMPQGDSGYLDCTILDQYTRCLEFTGSFSGELAVGDLGEIVSPISDGKFHFYLPFVMKSPNNKN